jgi:hypothetical protein
LFEGTDDRTTRVFASYCQMTGSDAYSGVSQIGVGGKEMVINKHDRDYGYLGSISDILKIMDFLTSIYLYRLAIFARAFLFAGSAMADTDD